MPTEIPTTSLREATYAWASFWSAATAIITTFAVPQITSADAYANHKSLKIPMFIADVDLGVA